MNIQHSKVLFVTQSSKAHGIGHVRRCMELAAYTESYFFIFSDADSATMLREFLGDRPCTLAIEDSMLALKETLHADAYQFIVVDLRQSKEELYKLLAEARIPIIAFDETEWGEKYADLFIQPLPTYKEKKGNFTELYYHPVSEPLYAMRDRVRTKPEEMQILVSFGGSDPENLALKVVQALCKLPNVHITVIEGPLAQYPWSVEHPDVQFIKAPKSLNAYIEIADVVFCFVGSTMVETLIAGRHVVMIQHSEYHNKIASHMPYALNLGLHQQVSSSTIVQSLRSLDSKRLLPLPADFSYREWWLHMLRQLQDCALNVCPLCKSYTKHALIRERAYTLFTCARCHSNFYSHYELPQVDYDESHFENEYQDRYGRSYKEDIPKIRAASRERIRIIKSILPDPSFGQPYRLLDVGSALGVFVDEASRHGLVARGVEASAFARQYANQEFAVESYESLEQVIELGIVFDIVSMWFVLERFSDPEAMLERLSSVLRQGGMLALSLPHGCGLLARFNQKLYKRVRPTEHEFEPSIAGTMTLLRSQGFKVIKKEIRGLHPERANLPSNALTRQATRVLQLGDTFEIYTIKK